jgi:hypothetical protein
MRLPVSGRSAPKGLARVALMLAGLALGPAASIYSCGFGLMF